MDRRGTTDGVETLLGDPKKAMVRIALPMMIAMSVQTVYNLADTIWVAGLGADALAAVGFSWPFFFMAIAIGAGVGMGGGAAISRRIGAKDKVGVDSVAVHMFLITVIVALLFTAPIVIFAEPMFLAIGAGDTVRFAVPYAQIVFGGSVFLFLSGVGNAILRSEGDARRAMYPMVTGAVINMILDPVLIYPLGMGIAGAAVATVLSTIVSTAWYMYWLLVRRDTYTQISFKGFRFRGDILRDIYRVGLPATVMQMSMAIMTFILNFFLVFVGGTDGVAVFSTGWRIVMIAILPLLGMSTAVVAVVGAAFGAHRPDKIAAGYIYAIKLGLIVEIPLAILTFALAAQITMVFTWSEDSQRIAGDLESMLRIIMFFFPTAVFGVTSSAFFQGTGKGLNALIVTLLRTVVFAPLFVWLLAFMLDLGIIGVWWGLVIGNTLAGFITFAWAMYVISGLEKGKGWDKDAKMPNNH